MFGIGPQELLVIMIVGLLVLGPKRLPEIARSLGRGLAEFRRASSDLRQSLSLEDDPPRRAAPSAPAQAGVGADAATTDEGDAEESGSVAVDSNPAEGRSIASSGHEDAADPEDRVGLPTPGTATAPVPATPDPNKKTPSGE